MPDHSVFGRGKVSDESIPSSAVDSELRRVSLLDLGSSFANAFSSHPSTSTDAQYHNGGVSTVPSSILFNASAMTLGGAPGDKEQENKELYGSSEERDSTRPRRSPTSSEARAKPTLSSLPASGGAGSFTRFNAHGGSQPSSQPIRMQGTRNVEEYGDANRRYAGAVHPPADAIDYHERKDEENVGDYDASDDAHIYDRDHRMGPQGYMEGGRAAAGGGDSGESLRKSIPDNAVELDTTFTQGLDAHAPSSSFSTVSPIAAVPTITTVSFESIATKKIVVHTAPADAAGETDRRLPTTVDIEGALKTDEDEGSRSVSPVSTLNSELETSDHPLAPGMRAQQSSYQPK